MALMSLWALRGWNKTFFNKIHVSTSVHRALEQTDESLVTRERARECSFVRETLICVYGCIHIAVCRRHFWVKWSLCLSFSSNSLRMYMCILYEFSLTTDIEIECGMSEKTTTKSNFIHWLGRVCVLFIVIFSWREWLFAFSFSLRLKSK